MKTKLTTLIAALVAMIIGLTTAVGQPPVEDASASVPPSIGGSRSSVTNLTGLTLEKEANRPHPASVQPGTGKVTVFPILTYPQNDVRSQTSIGHLLAGITNLWQGVSSNEHFAIIRDGKIGWRNLIYSQTGPTDWFLVQTVVRATSLNNLDDVCLADIRLSASSTSGTLNEPGYRVADGEGYGPLAYGVMTNGFVITSGPAVQKCHTVVFVIQPPAFNGGATPGGVDDAYRYIIKQVGFAITYKGWLDGDPASEGRTVVSLDGYNNQPVSLAISEAGANIWLVTGNTNRLYRIDSGPTVAGPWTIRGNVYTGDSLFIGPMDEGMRIFRATSLP